MSLTACTERLAICLLLTGLVDLSACAPRLIGPFKEVEGIPSGKAVIYIYRPSQATHPTFVAGNARVFYKEKPLAWFPYGGYYPLLVDPGELEIKTLTDAVTIDVKERESYFVRITTRTIGNDPRFPIAPVKRQEAYEDLEHCQLMEVKPEPDN